MQHVSMFSTLISRKLSSPVFCLLCSETPPSLRGPVTALCFSDDDSLLAGYESGLLELWQHNRVVGLKQVKEPVAYGTRALDWYLL